MPLLDGLQPSLLPPFPPPPLSMVFSPLFSFPPSLSLHLSSPRPSSLPLLSCFSVDSNSLILGWKTCLQYSNIQTSEDKGMEAIRGSSTDHFRIECTVEGEGELWEAGLIGERRKPGVWPQRAVLSPAPGVLPLSSLLSVLSPSQLP